MRGKKESAYFKNNPNVVTQVHWLVVVMHNNRSNIDVDLFGNGKCKEKNERDKSGRKRMTTSEIVKKCIMIKNTNIREKKNKNNKQISKRSIKWLRVHKWSGVEYGSAYDSYAVNLYDHSRVPLFTRKIQNS